MSKKRRGLSPKIRFEVFKRDGFRCQYCGAVAPDVLLQADHIRPVADGGDDDITNLITACAECNSGKAARLLDDKSVVAKQRKQLEELNERRLQLEMMMQWREGLTRLEDSKLTYAQEKFQSLSGSTLTKPGVGTLKKILRQFAVDEGMTAIEASCNQYLLPKQDGNGYEPDSIEKAFDYIGRICRTKRAEQDKPYLKDCLYVRGILNNRLSYVNQHDCMSLLERACSAAAST